MKNRLQVLMAVALLGAGSVQAMPMVYTASLTGSAENPPNASPGTGFAYVEYDAPTHQLRVKVDFENLIGTTTAAHIHCCVDAPGNIGVATTTPTFSGFPAGVTSGSYDQTFDLTLPASFNAAFITANGSVAGAEAALATGLDAGRAYFNIHTTFRPGGEIRGFLAAVPEPATLPLLGLGVVSLLAVRRKRRV
ncbi:MAG: CHRD domain-containing protein [Thiobacillus sp.]|nr:CHRD domain-containing protein [Thiobacillus sp.]